MPKLFQRRPSASLVIALLALFVALGGPAQAARVVRSADVKNRTLQVRDMSKKAVKSLQRTPRGSVGERALANRAITNAKIRDGAVTASKIAPAAVGSSQLAPNSVSGVQLQNGAVGATQIADGAVNGAKVADGSLTLADTARFSGRFSVEMPPVAPGTCWSGAPTGLAPQTAGADISNDLILVTPGAAWPDKLQFTVRSGGTSKPSQFFLIACNGTSGSTPTPAEPTSVVFRYAVLDIP